MIAKFEGGRGQEGAASSFRTAGGSGENQNLSRVSHYLHFCVAAHRELPALCHRAARSERVCHRVSGNRPAGGCPHSLSLQ